MTPRSAALRKFAVLALLVASTASQAALVFYTSKDGFLGATSVAGTDDFNDLANGASSGVLNRSAGAYSYTAEALAAGSGPSIFFNTRINNDTWLSTNAASDSIIFSGFSPAVRGVGGSFFNTDLIGNFLAGQVVSLQATDLSGEVMTEIFSNPTLNTFLGFVSDKGLSSLVLSSSPLNSRSFPTADNLILAGAATAASVPEPATSALIGVALLSMLAIHRRRRAPL